MRLRDHLITRTSLVATALVAGALGVASVTRSPAAEPGDLAGALAAPFEETVVITAPVDDLVLEMAPTREAYLLGEPVAFTARLTNVGEDRFLAPDAGVQDLAVERLASVERTGLGGTFLTLMDVTAPPIVLAPGQSVLKTIQVGAGEPFDRPGIHRVTGQWLLGDRTVRIPPFDVRIEATMPIAEKTGAVARPGA
jgi:hypothetical protein